MLRKVKELTDEEIIEILQKTKTECKYCPYESYTTKNGDFECPKNVKCYGGDVIYPMCYDNEEEVNKLIVDNFRDQEEEIEA